MESGRTAKSVRLARVALGLATAACLGLALTRIGHVLSFTTPLQLVTSGAEEEALASIWRFDHGRPVYTDPHLAPFTASYFNWLFYTVYGIVAGGDARLLSLSDWWLPTLCRLVTLALALGGAAILARLVQREHGPWLPGIVLGALAFFNPLSGFWIVTARPDVGAAVLELAGVGLFLRHQRTRGWADLVAVALLLEAAWAFKQTSVGALLGIMLALAWSRLRHPEIDGYRRGALVAALLAAGALVPFIALGPVYRHGLYLSQIHSGFHATWALLHFGAAVMKMPFIAVALAGAALTWRRSDDALRAISLVLAATFAVELAASCKGGAGDYYFLSLGVGSVLWIGFALVRFPSRPLANALAPAALLQIAAVGAVLAGHRGTIDPRAPAEPYEHLAAYLATRPGPVFVTDTYGDLPWISPTEPHFVIACNNQVDERAGATFQDGGWRGLIARGYFTTVVTRAAHPEITGALPGNYRLVREETGWRYYERFRR